MIKLLPTSSILALLLTPLLVGCPELDELNRGLNSSTSSSTTSSAHVNVTAKQFTLPDKYYLYYSDGSYDLVTQATYNSVKIGDSKTVTTFTPPAAKVSRKFFTQDFSYIIECDDQTRKDLPEAQYDRINIGDTCP